MTSRVPPALWKQRSWSPDIIREEAWKRRKGLAKRRTRSLTDDDIEELKACIELGFGFESPEINPKLTDTIPALDLYYAVVNKQYGGGRSISRTSSMSSSVGDESDQMEMEISSPLIDQRDDPEAVKVRLRQWAQVVGCAVREAVSSSPKRAELSFE